MKKLIALPLALFFSLALAAQSRTSSNEFGLGVGTLNYYGDIATTRSTSALFAEMRPNFSFLAKRNFNDLFALGVDVSYGFLYASDENHSQPNRGMSVTTSIMQLNPFAELNLIRFGKFHYDRKFTLYIKAGGGVIAYNPEISVQEVFPSNVDPEPNAYTGFNFFGGAGMRFRLGFKSVLSLEAARHMTTVDDLDGFLYNDGTGGKNDSYGGVKVIFTRMFF